MAQGLLPFQYEFDSAGPALSALGGLPLYLELAAACGLPGRIARRLGLRPTQGFSDVQQVMALVMLNLAGGESLDDLRQLQADEGLVTLLGELERHGLRAGARRRLQSRFRAQNQGALPSPTSAARYLEAFHDPEQEHLRQPNTAFVPAPSAPLDALSRLPSDLVAFAQDLRPEAVATLDQDATLGRTHKRDALFCYKHYKAYQPLNVWWAEHQMVLYSEFRDGNCPAGWRNLEVFEHSLGLLPEGVERVRFRGDTAAYESELLRFMAEGRSSKGVVDFAVSVDVTAAFRQAVAEVRADAWQTYHHVDAHGPMATDQQVAEVCFVPQWAGLSKKGPSYRFLAIREPLAQGELPGMDDSQGALPFPVACFEGQRYKLFGVVTNLDPAQWTAEQVVAWHRERCGRSEKAHAVMKTDLAGGRFPSGLFGANAAWWQIMLVALNLQALMDRHVFEEVDQGRRMKHVRFALINLPARVVHSGRRTRIRLPHGHPALERILAARRRMSAWSTGPPGPWLAAV